MCKKNEPCEDCAKKKQAEHDAIIAMQDDETAPYVEIACDEPNTIVRVFLADQPAHRFKWHFDEEDRTIEVISPAHGWQFQYDNQLPFKLKHGMKFEIKKGGYHRLIKGNLSITLKIHKHK